MSSPHSQALDSHAARPLTEHGDHPPGLAHHFESFAQQRESSTLGMWLFLVTEIMFFGGMFLAYTLYRREFPLAFQAGSHSLSIGLGVFNTAVLIGSSLTMALAVRAAQLSWRKGIVLFLVLTILLGGIFLGVKVIEYSQKGVPIPVVGPWVLSQTPEPHHIYVPGDRFHFEGEGKFQGAAENNVQMFFSLYFAMTGTHALHMIIGIAIMLFMLRPAWRGRWNTDNHNFVEGFGLYWHFVDIVWIFLFPLLYLIGRH